jgi:outer membrane protein
MNAFFESKIFKQILPIILLVGVIYAAVLATMLYRAPSARIGYVDVKTMMQQYPAAVKAQKEYDQKTEELKQKNQALQSELGNLQQDYAANHEKWDRSKLAAKEMEFKRKQEVYARFAQSANATAQQLQQELLQPVFTEMRAKIAEFGKAQGYSLILESTEGGTVLYGDKGVDVSDAFVKYAQSKN